MGQTGVGKSAFCRAMTHGVDSLIFDDDEVLNSQGPPVMSADREVFRIGHNVESCTECPEFFKKNNVYIVDCPGLEDSDPTKEFPNIDAIHQIMINAKSVQILLLFSKSQLEASRGAAFVKTINKFVSLISDSGINNANSFITPILTRADFNRNAERVLQKKCDDMNAFIDGLIDEVRENP